MEIVKQYSNTVFLSKQNNKLSTIKVCDNKNKESINLFKNETTILNTLNFYKCKNVPKIIKIRTTNNSNTRELVLKHIKGETLGQYLLNNNNLSSDIILVIFGKLVEILKDVLTKTGIYHRDLKLANIIINHTNDKFKVHIIDWGLSSFIKEDKENICGTRRYMAPEMISFPYVLGPCNDVWSLGVILYYMCTNRYPFDVLIIPGEDSKLYTKRLKTEILYCEIDYTTLLSKTNDDNFEKIYKLLRDLILVKKAKKRINLNTLYKLLINLKV
jgi:serine/threonine protein kinase